MLNFYSFCILEFYSITFRDPTLVTVAVCFFGAGICIEHYKGIIANQRWNLPILSFVTFVLLAACGLSYAFEQVNILYKLWAVLACFIVQTVIPGLLGIIIYGLVRRIKSAMVRS